MGLTNKILQRLQPKSNSRPIPPKNCNNYVLLILDSCRFDSFLEAKLPLVQKLQQKFGDLERRYAYATWTAPSHYNLLCGLLPHSSPQHVFASTYYKTDFAKFSERLQLDVNFDKMLPHMWLPKYLQEIGYYTRAIVSMPVLNAHTPLSMGFDSYQMTDKHNDLTSIIDQMEFSRERPTFYLINTGETHYPYAPIHEPENQWPRIHGTHGVFKQFSEGQGIHTHTAPQFFNVERLEQLRKRQILVLDTVEKSLEKLLDTLPQNTYLTITSDHGELFGESNYFGHGPIHHEKVLEVPFLEGKI